MPRPGQSHHKAKLSDEQVADMRRTYERWKAAGDRRGYQSLGEIYGAPWPIVRDIVTYRTRYSA